MKHPLQTTLLLLALFVAAQVVGLLLINQSIESVAVNLETGELELNHTTTAIGERPQLEGVQSFLYLVFGVSIGTALLLLLIRFRKVRLWKAWFFLAVFLAQSVAFGVLLPQLYALALALLLSIFKIYKPNPWVHNITEVFMYAGIAVLLVPILDVFWSLILLLAISLYDAWAVWRSKHMVAMAEFQKSSSVFAGLMVPKKEKGSQMEQVAKEVSKTKIASVVHTVKKKVKLVKNKDEESKKCSSCKRTGYNFFFCPKCHSWYCPIHKHKDTCVELVEVTEKVKEKGSQMETPPLPKKKGLVSHAILGGGDIAFPLLFTGAVMEGFILSGVPRMTALAQSLVITVTTTLAIGALFLWAKRDRYYPAMPFITAGCIVGWLLTFLF